MMTNREVARTLNQIADMLEIKDDKIFKVKAYRQAGNSIYHLDEDIYHLYEKGRLDEIPGVGQAIRAKIEELIEKGSCEYYERLLEEIPNGVLEMLSIPGVGHKTVKLVFEKMGIGNRQELLQAAKEKKIRNLPGMGVKTEESIIKGIEMLDDSSDKNTLGLVLPLAEEFLSYIMSCDKVMDASLAGSIRRGKSLVSDIDIVVASEDEAAVRRAVKDYRPIKRIISSEAGYIAGILQFDLAFEIIIVLPGEFCSGLFRATGSKEHLERLMARADGDICKGCENEKEIYERLHLPYIQPELRENQGEIETAATGHLPELVEMTDIQGDLHVHSIWSDGANPIAEMAETARLMNYSYLAITDHSRFLTISGGLSEERLKAQGEEIDRLNGNGKNFKILKGTEVDVLRDGSLDFSSEVLRDLDIVIASVHSNFKLDKEKQTERIIRAIKDNNVDIIGHLSGRLLNRRPAYELDFEQILEEAAKNQVILEINSHPDRLDIDAELARRASEYGIKIAINSDAHHKNEFKLLRYGVINARRGWLEKSDVINTWTLDQLSSYIKE
jgi:DNA polymerase (family 10)